MQTTLDKLSIVEDANLITFRITPCGKYTAPQVEKYIQQVTKDPKIIRFLFYREGVETKHLHYHGLIETTHQSQNTIKGRVRQCVPKLKGNAQIAFKFCLWKGEKLQASELWKSKTYVAKEGDLMHNKGYSQQELKEIQAVGASLSKKTLLPKYQLIPTLKKLDYNSSISDIVHAVYDYYKDINKPIPSKHMRQKLIQNVHAFINPDFRAKLIHKDIDDHENLCAQIGWDATTYNPYTITWDSEDDKCCV